MWREAPDKDRRPEDGGKPQAWARERMPETLLKEERRIVMAAWKRMVWRPKAKSPPAEVNTRWELGHHWRGRQARPVTGSFTGRLQLTEQVYDRKKVSSSSQRGSYCTVGQVVALTAEGKQEAWPW